MNYQEELRTALEKVQGVIEKHWNEIQDDENCPQSAEVIPMLIDSLGE